MNEQIRGGNDAGADSLIAAGNVLEDSGDISGALAKYHEAREIDPDSPRVHLNCGNALLAMAKMDEAVAAYHEALRVDPQYASAHANLARALMQQKKFSEAATQYSAAIAANPEFADGYVGLGCALEELEQWIEAIQAYASALEIRPNYPGASYNLGQLLLKTGQLDEAEKHLRDALQAEPNNAFTHVWLGKTLADMGILNEGMEHLRRGAELAPDVPYPSSMMLFYSNYLPEISKEELFRDHVRFGQQFCDSLTPTRPNHVNVADPDRPLRLGYVSGDFRNHPVARFIEPVLAAHDRSLYEVHCFHNFEGTDDPQTNRLRQAADRWHRIAGMDDGAAADLVRQSRIDILVDLSGHTDRNRLVMFARKPAPVQVTWLGYLGTTGIRAMDYRICDGYTDPPGLTEQFHTERLARLPQGQWCHKSYDTVMVPTGALPMQKNGYPTFGSINNISKINGDVLALWGRVLTECPTARLRMAAIVSDRSRQLVVSVFLKAGIDPARIEFVPRTGYHEYLSGIRELDIVLDPFPYNGGTTTVDALAMGVPVVTLAGDRSISRGGLSLLSTVGLSDFVARNHDEYVAVVKKAVSDPESLLEIRKGLRDRVGRSVLQNSQRFTNQLEMLYRELWCEWCKQ